MGKVAELLELILVVAIITQMIIPWVCGTPMWPLFRAKKTGKLISEIEHEKQIEVEIALRKELEELRAKHAAQNEPQAPSQK